MEAGEGGGSRTVCSGYMYTGSIEKIVAKGTRIRRSKGEQL